MTKMHSPNGTSIGLRMKGTNASISHHCCEEINDYLIVLNTKDTEYASGDYLTGIFSSFSRDEEEGGETRMGIDSCSFKDCEEPIDTVCREKMVDWAFRVSDHFNTSREIVSYAFSFLDRFAHKCSCDRTAFKLASMTSLYMATKLFNSKHISIECLADLSRGEFTVDHVSEMERVILQTLDWKMNPPIIQSFIGYLQLFLSVEESSLQNTIYERAIFFAELAMFDYELIVESRFKLSIASILNAMEGMDDSAKSRKIQDEFLLQIISIMPPIFLNVDEIDRIQDRLWFLYSCSAQLHEDDSFVHHATKHPIVQRRAKDIAKRVSDSPVSVRQY